MIAFNQTGEKAIEYAKVIRWKTMRDIEEFTLLLANAYNEAKKTVVITREQLATAQTTRNAAQKHASEQVELRRKSTENANKMYRADTKTIFRLIDEKAKLKDTIKLKDSYLENQRKTIVAQRDEVAKLKDVKLSPYDAARIVNLENGAKADSIVIRSLADVISDMDVEISHLNTCKQGVVNV